MRYVLAEPSHHPTAWVALILGCLSLGLVVMTSSQGNLGLTGLLISLSITAMGLAELLPGRLRYVTIVLRIISLVLAVATIVVAVSAMVF